jgi:hypothetical protein
MKLPRLLFVREWLFWPSLTESSRDPRRTVVALPRGVVSGLTGGRAGAYLE